MVVARPSGCFHRAWPPLWRAFAKPSFFATLSRSPALAGIRCQHGYVRRKRTPLLRILLHEHAENVRELGLRFCGGPAHRLAARDRRQISNESPIVLRSDDDRVAVKGFRIGAGHGTWIVIKRLPEDGRFAGDRKCR